MRKTKDTPYHSKAIGSLPKGCRYCVRGEKLVLLVTGVCSRSCWYCPLSGEKAGKDAVVANEWWISDKRDVITETLLSGAKGAGITGGDPLCRIERTVGYIKALKKEFGNEFHIHLYTTGENVTEKKLSRLYDAGLDEIRFHPRFLDENTDLTPIKLALGFRWDVGVEVPAIPGRVVKTKKFLKKVDEMGVAFANINELEISETNAVQMEERKMRPVNGVSFAVKGSKDAAEKLLSYALENLKLSVHFCTVKLKDSVQLRNRLKKRAKNTAREYDVVTGEGLLIRGAVYVKGDEPSFGYSKKAKTKPKSIAALKRYAKRLENEYGLGDDLAGMDQEGNRLLVAPWVLEEIAGKVKEDGFFPAILEEYPTWDRLITDLRAL